jgi:hypothetical protein
MVGVLTFGMSCSLVLTVAGEGENGRMEGDDGAESDPRGSRGVCADRASGRRGRSGSRRMRVVDVALVEGEGEMRMVPAIVGRVSYYI